MVRDRVMASNALTGLMADVNAEAITSRREVLMIHGGAVALGTGGLVLSGPSGAGKSTLTAALVQEGCDYLTDEAVAIDRATLGIEPYPKPLSLSWASQQVLGVAGSADLGELVPSSRLRAKAVGTRTRVRSLLFPRFEVGADDEVHPISRGDAFVRLAENSFNFVDRGGRWLPYLGDIVTACSCWELRVGDAGAAARHIVRTLESSDGRL